MEELFGNKYFLAIAAAIGSALLTILVQYILNKRSLLKYFVFHNQIGLSTDDSIFGSVRVTWNDNNVSNLYLSTIELVNESMKDHENVVVRVFTSDTELLTEKTEIVGTTYPLKWTNEYFEKLNVEEGLEPTDQQIKLYRTQRDYIIPTFNRGESIHFTYLNSATTDAQPTLWLDIVHKGIKLKFRRAYNKILNVSQPIAGAVGLLIGILLLGIIIMNVQSIWVVAILSFIYGLFAQLPGAITVKLWKKVKQILIG